MVSMTSAGSELAVSAAAPATQTSAGYAALTYTPVGGVSSIGSIGATYGEIEFVPLIGATETHKGGVNYGSLTPSMASDDSDAGQTILATATDSQTALLSVRVTKPDGKRVYCQARCFSLPDTIGEANTIIMRNANLKINVKPVPHTP